MKDIYIIGAGGMGKEVAFLIEEINKKQEEWNLVGFIDENDNIHNNTIYGYKVLGNCQYLNTIHDEIIHCVIAISGYDNKNKILQLLNYLNKKINYPTLIHPKSLLANNVIIGKGTIISPYVSIQPNVVIEDNVFIGTRCNIMHDVNILSFSDIMVNSTCCSYSSIGEGCLVGASSTILNGVKLKSKTRINPGSMVNSDIG